MKLFCEYCGASFNDTETVCPHCGAPSAGVKRTASAQPVTVEQLRQWYADRGLPSYETTRFFIGEDYRGAKAFGIYQDPDTGNFVVYKNKADGTRAVRYEGTDEAYAVNELLQRLKEEILQQKKAVPSPGARGVFSGTGKREKASDRKGFRGFIARHPFLCGALAVLFGPSLLTGIMNTFTGLYDQVFPAPQSGYYAYDGDTYYCLAAYENDSEREWFVFLDEEADWMPVFESTLPKQFRRDRTARSSFLLSDWDSSLGVSDFTASDACAAQYLDWSDRDNNYEVPTGYYDYDGVTYYHAADAQRDGWYCWDTVSGDWSASYDTPDDLQHAAVAQDFYYTPVWDAGTQLYDFEDSACYDDFVSTYTGSDTDSGRSWNNDSDDNDYDWDSSDSWDSGSSDWDSDW